MATGRERKLYLAGILMLVYAGLGICRPSRVLRFAMIWLAAWSWLSLPAPGPWLYLVFGGSLLLASVVLSRRSTPSD